MSRIGRAAILTDDKTKVTVGSNNIVTVKGAKSSMEIQMQPQINAKIEGNKIVLTRKDETKESKSLHGLYRALIQNAVIGLSRGFSKSLELQGVGYRASVAGKKLELTLGFSHPISFEIPEGVEIKVDKQTLIHITTHNKELLGQVAAKIRSFRPPEPYLGKGVRYVGEKVRKKEGKSAGK
jgi:large subunit ribosomal protein L6